MVSNSGKSDLETLAKLGVTDNNGRLTIQLGSKKRRLTPEEESLVSAAIKGYKNPDLPESIKTSGIYSHVEIFHLAAAAANGVPDSSSSYDGWFVMHQILEGQLEDLRYPSEIPQQFINGLIDLIEFALFHAEDIAGNFVDYTKINVTIEPAKALQSAVEATYPQALVNTLRPQVDAIKKTSYSPATQKQ